MNNSFVSRSLVAPQNNPTVGPRTWALATTMVLVVVWSMTGCNTDMAPSSAPSSGAKVVDKQPVSKGEAPLCCQVPPKEPKTIAPSIPAGPPTKGAAPSAADPGQPAVTAEKPEQPATSPDQPAEPEDKSVYKLAPVPEGYKRTKLASDIYFETAGEKAEKGRRVVVVAEICLRQSQYMLEGFLTKGKGKEHEYILAMDVDALNLHRALLATGAKSGSPVQFEPKYSPAHGTPIKVTIRYLKDGKLVSIPAQQWIRDAKTKKDLAQDWVFAGSRFVPDLEDENKRIYAANWGDVVCVNNMDSAMLDLPIPARNAPGIENRMYEAHTERIPPIGTKVELVFEPVLEKK